MLFNSIFIIIIIIIIFIIIILLDSVLRTPHSAFSKQPTMTHDDVNSFLCPRLAHGVINW